eukprot:CAMPEP_0172563206 /NCGR_PEP_ID=MMETSP1067-20121228/99966_1 /TAXON_ID=265564 ORGANISM="Thalassiosira punctigera, Strain Tpunct2005C2" /NCGR_SAMPLE_ID=MMETSP1067 /ASSEMBLY_ACC=CAM_ASM_000444 /LENGTH=637 /DNA_ID=CAMNT_0013353605 /DNA_START=141 /DNA_END=2054 /DNA_ORIENTATION=+
MTRLLLDIGYDSSAPFSATRNLPGIGDASHDEANLALLEAIHQRSGEGNENVNSDDADEIIRLLIRQGGANPHLSVAPLGQSRGETTRREAPLSAAARAGDAGAISCMLDAYSSALVKSSALRRSDPLLRSQPESYFRLVEERECDTEHSSVDAALVASLFSLWREGGGLSSFGRCALVLYRRRAYHSSRAVPRHLSQHAMQWLENCLSMRCLVRPPVIKNNPMEGYYFEAPLVKYHIPKGMLKSVNKDSHSMDWSHVLAGLPWFNLRMNGVSCSWMHNISNPSEKKQVDCNTILAEDEFFLVVGGEKLLAHKSIVSSKSEKLAAHIRFTEGHEREYSLEGRLSVHVDLPLLTAKMLLCHCYHGSIIFGLVKSPMKQCHQLLEMALIAEEYLCPSLLLECEIRLLMQPSFPSCICLHCSSGAISSKEHIHCPIRLQCLEKAQKNFDNDSLLLYCEPMGVYAYKTSTFIMSSSRNGLVTPESAIDVLAVAQQLEQSSSLRDLYTMKYCRSGSIDDPNSTMVMPSYCGWDINVEKDVGAGCIAVPFASVKMMAIWIMLRDFSEVIRSNSYLRQIKSDDDEDETAEVDASFGMESHAANDEDAMLLLRTCLEELASSPFSKNAPVVEKCTGFLRRYHKQP